MYEMQQVHVDAAGGGKPADSFSTTGHINNNNNELYANRNAYDYQSTAVQQAIKQCDAAQNGSLENATDRCPAVAAEHAGDDGGPCVGSAFLKDEPGHSEGGSGPAAVLHPDQEPSDDSDLGSGPVPVPTDADRPDRVTPSRAAVIAWRFTKQRGDALRGVTKDKAWFMRRRRPLNDFLIFCKVHRRIVRSIFVGKENRFMSKKLGNWWRGLNEEQKQPYKKLADEHRIEYMEMFPDYRWGKAQPKPQQPMPIPEPMPFVVADEQQKPMKGNDVMVNGGEVEDCNLEAARCLVEMASGVGLPVMNTFKLADETQMGRLSSLMNTGCNLNAATAGLAAGAGGEGGDLTNGAAEHNYSVAGSSITDNADPIDMGTGLHNGGGEPYANMRQLFLEQSRPKQQPVVATAAAATTTASTVANVGEAAAPAGRATRSCKGKRYQEFMSQQRLASAIGRRQTHKRPTATITGNAGASNGIPPVAAALPVNGTRPMPADDGGVVENVAPTPARVADQEAVVTMYHTLYGKIDLLPVANVQDFLAQQKSDKRRKKPYAMSSKAAKKRKMQTPKNGSGVVKPSYTETSATIAAPGGPSIPMPCPSPQQPPYVAPPCATLEAPLVPTSPPPTPTTSRPPAPPVAAKIVGCRKRKAPKELIIRHTAA